ncbi:hypothetical protein EX30DRAFT_393518 [Ascodesmis nigricans]|uniref:Zn(2)-C6 fungal-type domain-containing protein n=1 Tax=Ascodesmis nigricans TaxID=341454 RepID=A0A4S2N3Z7_9PEZI|nr:hypothetical protein EX30DRAFT_393518 [Ascodesmis nigricans]
MPARRSHTKSRNGCANCKRRRIKCDEVKPTCNNCSKHAIQCDFESRNDKEQATTPGSTTTGSASPSSAPRRGPPKSRRPTAPTNSMSPVAPLSTPPPNTQPTPVQHSLLPAISSRVPEDLSQAPTLPPLSGFLSNRNTLILPPVFQPLLHHDLPPQPHNIPTALPPPGSESFSLTDLSLMHNWTLYTADTISNRPEICTLWRHQIPLIAAQNPFLMHAILAISALHGHHLNPARADLLAVASHHHDSAVRGMALTLADISRDNCDALVVSSCLVVVYSFVSAKLDPGPDDIATWMPLLRGVHSILKQSYVWVTVTGGPLAALIKQYIMKHVPELDKDTDRELTELYKLCTDRSIPGSEELDETDVSTAYFSAIAELRKSYASMNEWENIIGSIFTWPITVSDRYVELLVERRPRALIIFVYYCGLFVGLESFWWSKGSGLFELQRIEKMLGPEWEEWTVWPKKRILEKARTDQEEQRSRQEEAAAAAAVPTPSSPSSSTAHPSADRDTAPYSATEVAEMVAAVMGRPGNGVGAGGGPSLLGAGQGLEGLGLSLPPAALEVVKEILKQQKEMVERGQREEAEKEGRRNEQESGTQGERARRLRVQGDRAISGE